MENHSHKYIFTLMYVPCVDGNSIYGNMKMTVVSTTRQALLHLERLTTHLIWEDQSAPVPKRKLQPFYLVPKALWWILAPYTRALYINDSECPAFQPGDPKNSHSNQYQFRLFYLICTEKRLLSGGTSWGHAYLDKKDCQHLVDDKRTIHLQWEDKNRPIPRQTVEAFYFVPEQLYWILAPYAKAFNISDRRPMLLINPPGPGK